MAPGSKRRSGEPSNAPPTLAPDTIVAARTAARCCERRPGMGRRARIFTIWKGWPVTVERVSAVRRICPPPSPTDPSRVNIGNAGPQPLAVLGSRRAGNEVTRRLRQPPAASLEVRQEGGLGERVREGRQEALYGARHTVPS